MTSYTLLAFNLHFDSLSTFGGLGTFEQLEQGHEIEKYVMAGSKLFKKCFHA